MSNEVNVKGLDIPFANAICYSGYREGQSPITGNFPSYGEIKEDLLILAKNWRYLRMYDCGPHVEMVLAVIRNESLPFQVMIGAALDAEVSNPQCPWGGVYSDDVLAANKLKNQAEIAKMAILANAYPDLIFAVSVGNEASVEWNDHMVPVDSLVDYVRRLKSQIKQPITFCENYVPWGEKLAPLVAELDFISIHTYPVWEYKTVEEALAYTQANYDQVANRYPDKPVVITEAGWTTGSNGRGIEPWNANQELQAIYYQQLMDWTQEQKVLTFVFEAFDEPWKGSGEPLEPEKHWGLFFEDRTPKLVMQKLYTDEA